MQNSTCTYNKRTWTPKTMWVYLLVLCITSKTLEHDMWSSATILYALKLQSYCISQFSWSAKEISHITEIKRYIYILFFFAVDPIFMGYAHLGVSDFSLGVCVLSLLLFLFNRWLDFSPPSPFPEFEISFVKFFLIIIFCRLKKSAMVNVGLN